MNHGRGIRLFLVDGSPNGLLTAEIMNWTGHALTGPRTKLTELVQRPECGRTGVYFLVGPDPDNAMRPLVYIGESDDVAKRLKQHNRPEDQGGEDFWERMCLITSKDQTLTKAQLRHLQSRLIQISEQSAWCGIVNLPSPDEEYISEIDRADMRAFIEQVRIVMPILGFDFLRSPIDYRGYGVSFELDLPSHGVKAEAEEIDDVFIVLEGSKARPRWTGKATAHGQVYEQLVKDGFLSDQQGGVRLFTRDVEFSNPNIAASVVAGRDVNGRQSWQMKGGFNRSYGQLHDMFMDKATEPDENSD